MFPGFPLHVLHNIAYVGLAWLGCGRIPGQKLAHGAKVEEGVAEMAAGPTEGDSGHGAAGAAREGRGGG